MATHEEVQLLTQAAYLQAEAYGQILTRLPGIQISGLRDWAVSPDACLHLIELVELHRPRLVVELGSGSSTVVLASALQRWVPDGRLISFEHADEFVASTRALLGRNGLTNAEVRLSPLEPLANGPASRLWYSLETFSEVEDVGMLFIDGPPAQLERGARHGSLSIVRRMANESIVALDDTKRPEEGRLATRWAEATGGDRYDIDTEKGLAVVVIEDRRATADESRAHS